MAVQRYGLALNGGVMVLVTAAAALHMLGYLPAVPVAAFTVLVLAGYGALLIVPREEASDPRGGVDACSGAGAGRRGDRGAGP